MATSNGQSRAFFSAVYDALRLGDGMASVYKNDDGRYWAGSSGAFRGQLQPTPPREVASNVSLILLGALRVVVDRRQIMVGGV